jgi:hypothetical protein
MSKLLNTERKHSWIMPEFSVDLYFNKRLARTLAGKHVLVGITHLTEDGKVKRQEQHHGSVVAVDSEDGVEIWENDTTKIFSLPPDLRAWERAKKGTYTLRATGEDVTDVDYISSWIMQPGHSQPIPHGGKLAKIKSGAYNFYGVGTKLYGHSNKLSDGSYTVTKWIVALYLPVLPLGSYRILAKRRTGMIGYSAASVHKSEPVFLDVQQVIITYLISIPILALAVIFLVRTLN